VGLFRNAVVTERGWGEGDIGGKEEGKGREMGSGCGDGDMEE